MSQELRDKIANMAESISEVYRRREKKEEKTDE
jgi:hypothetical protein